MIQPNHSWAHFCKILNKYIEEMLVHLCLLFTIEKKQIKPRCPSDKMCYIYTMQFYSATKKLKLGYLQENAWNQRLSYLSEMNQTQKEKYFLSYAKSRFECVCTYVYHGIRKGTVKGDGKIIIQGQQYNVTYMGH